MNYRFCAALCALLLVFAGCADPSLSVKTSDERNASNDTSASMESSSSEWKIFEGQITEIDKDWCIIVPTLSDVIHSNPGDYYLPVSHIEGSRPPEVGDEVILEYDGRILESNPAQFGETRSIRLVE